MAAVILGNGRGKFAAEVVIFELVTGRLCRLFVAVIGAVVIVELFCTIAVVVMVAVLVVVLRDFDLLPDTG